jgi:hypothetical protein
MPQLHDARPLFCLPLFLLLPNWGIVGALEPVVSIRLTLVDTAPLLSAIATRHRRVVVVEAAASPDWRNHSTWNRAEKAWVEMESPKEKVVKNHFYESQLCREHMRQSTSVRGSNTSQGLE